MVCCILGNMLSLWSGVLLLGGLFGVAVGGGVPTTEASDDTCTYSYIPFNPSTSDTTKYCSWWVNTYSRHSCEPILEVNRITLQQFLRWVSPLPPLNNNTGLNAVERTPP